MAPPVVVAGPAMACSFSTQAVIQSPLGQLSGIGVGVGAGVAIGDGALVGCCGTRPGVGIGWGVKNTRFIAMHAMDVNAKVAARMSGMYRLMNAFI